VLLLLNKTFVSLIEPECESIFLSPAGKRETEIQIPTKKAFQLGFGDAVLGYRTNLENIFFSYLGFFFFCIIQIKT
jgi:hypothetical protein